MSVRSSVLPYEAFQGLVEVLLGLPRPFGPSDSVLLGLLRLRKALIGSLKPFDASRGPLRCRTPPKALLSYLRLPQNLMLFEAL